MTHNSTRPCTPHSDSHLTSCLLQFGTQLLTSRREAQQAGQDTGCDLLSQFLQLRDECTGQALPDATIIDMVLNFLLAGRWGAGCWLAVVLQWVGGR